MPLVQFRSLSLLNMKVHAHTEVYRNASFRLRLFTRKFIVLVYLSIGGIRGTVVALDLLTSSPAHYHCTTDVPVVGERSVNAIKFVELIVMAKRLTGLQIKVVNFTGRKCQVKMDLCRHFLLNTTYHYSCIIHCSSQQECYALRNA